MTRIPTWLSASALAMVMVAGVSYLGIGVLGYSPTATTNTVTVDLSEAGGLRVGSDVVNRGVGIGGVDEIESVSDGVRLRISYDSAYRLPVDAALKVENLSALGEPVFAFLPRSEAGPWLTDGAHLHESVAIPTSVPELLVATSTLLDQTDPEATTRLVQTFVEAMRGLDEVMPTISRGADLLVATLLRHHRSLDTVLANVMRLMPRAGWVKPVLTAAPPQLEAFGVTLGDSYEYLFEGSAVLRGREVLGSWREEEAQLVRYLERVSPEIGAIGTALRPVTTASGPLLGMVDIGSLLDQATKAFPGDRVRLAVTMPPP